MSLDQGSGCDVILTDKQVTNAWSSHAVNIVAFVEAQEIPFHYFEKPYYLAPAPGGEKPYALLREALRRTRKVGIVYVVIQMRRQLAALVPHGKALVLNTLRYSSQMRRFDNICIDERNDEEIAEADISESELIAASQLVNSMTKQWKALHQDPAPQPDLAASGYRQAQPENLPELIELEELPDQVEEENFDQEAMDALWGRPHRRPPPSALRAGRWARSRRRSR